MSHLLSAAPAAGWYPDPIVDAQLRWWDGDGWTERVTAPLESSVLQVAEPVRPAAATIPTGPLSRRDVHPRLEPSAISTPTPRQESITPFSRIGSTTISYVPQVKWTPARSSTPAAWGLAFMPWISGVITALGAYARTVSGYPDLIGAATIATPLLLTIALVVRDRRGLQALGHERPAREWWVLIAPPLVYLIARTVSTHRNNGMGSGALVAYLVNSALVVVTGAVAFVMFSALVGVDLER